MSNTNILLESGTNELEIVEFFLNEKDENGELYNGYYGINVAKVLEIIQVPEITELPEVSHPSVLGAFNQRSEVIPLVDLTLWLGKERVELEPPKVVITEFNQITTAFLVSGVTRIHRISWEEVMPPGTYVSSVSDNSITGVVKLEGRIVFILDLETLITRLNPSLAMHLDEDMVFDTGTTYKALVADDSVLVRKMLAESLKQAGFMVEIVEDGREAWERLVEISRQAKDEGKELSEFVNVVITDIEMPRMDGHNLTKRIREDQLLKNLPVILFSSMVTDKLRHKGEAVGADEQITKPEVSRLAVFARKIIKEHMASVKSIE